MKNATSAPEVATALEWGGYIIRPGDPKHTDVDLAPDLPGIYGWYTSDGDLIYVGRAGSISDRLHQHLRRTNFWGGPPQFYSYRVVPDRYLVGVEVAHIKTLQPRENQFMEAGMGLPFLDELRATIADAWRVELPIQQARVNNRYAAIADQIAARLK